MKIVCFVSKCPLEPKLSVYAKIGNIRNYTNKSIVIKAVQIWEIFFFNVLASETEVVKVYSTLSG